MVARTIVLLSMAAILACSQPAARDPDRPSAESGGQQMTEGPADAAPEPRSSRTRALEPRSDGGSADPTDIRATLLAEHNRYREAHCAEPLAWSEHLEDIAAQWADELLSRGCPLEHSQHRYGENLAAGSPGALDAARVVWLWYEEVELYDFDRPDFSMETGHFTQVVWRGTRELGCAQTSCDGIDIWVCNYAPAGNVLNAFAQNVQPASCDE
jgi:uncharacterized protein YkwD